MDNTGPTSTLIPTAVKTDRTFAILAHLGGIFFGFIPSLIIYLIKKSEPNSEFDLDQAKEALNFQITVAIAWFACFTLMLVFIGALLIPVLLLGNLIFCVIAAVKASNGEAYRYPFTLRLIK